MKARLKHTNQIINVERDPLGWSWESPKGNVILDTEELIFLDDDFDWQSFRAEAAKNILAGILAHANICISETDKTRLTKLALSYTEELIRQLKEKEEK